MISDASIHMCIMGPDGGFLADFKTRRLVDKLLPLLCTGDVGDETCGCAGCCYIGRLTNEQKENLINELEQEAVCPTNQKRNS